MGVGYLKGERITGGETTKGKWSGLSVRGGSEGGGGARHKETSGVEYLERKGVDMTYGSCWFTETC